MGIFAVLEETLHESFVHDGHRFGCFVIGWGKISAAEEGYSEVLQIVRAYSVPGRAGFFAGRWSGMASH
jgi:hypothetical protein